MQSYSTIVGVIELRLRQISYSTIGTRYRIGNSTITLIMHRFEELGKSLDELKAMPPREVETIFYPPENLMRAEKPLPNFDLIHKRMLAMEHPDLSFLWLEYKEQFPGGYQLTQFYKLYGDYLRENYGPDAKMAIERVPGEKMYIDWVGDQPELLTNPATGELQKVHIFTTTLGFSSCVYAEIFSDEKLPHFIAGVTHALDYYGAVPKHLVPDNLRTAVKKHTKDELLFNSAFADLEEFYDTIILPPPARKPRGKATVENHVRFLETHLVEKLKENIYTSLETLNAAVKKIIADINQRDFQNKRDIRKSRQRAFEAYDKPRMHPLPGGSFVICDYKSFSRVPDNYHLEYDGHYYSVLYTYLGKPAILKATLSEIRICDADNKLIRVHMRSYRDFPRYITEDEDMPAEHRYYKDQNIHDAAYYRRWASVYGEAMVTLIDRMLKSVKHEEQAYNGCNGVLHLCDNVPRYIVEETAQACVDASACKYTYFKKELSRRVNARSQSGSAGHLPAHENIRGRDSYQ